MENPFIKKMPKKFLKLSEDLEVKANSHTRTNAAQSKLDLKISLSDPPSLTTAEPENFTVKSCLGTVMNDDKKILFSESSIESTKFDPFSFFNLPYDFEIPNLEKIYYMFYKKQKNLEQVNEAYKILQNEVKKLMFLCEHFAVFDNHERSTSLIQEIFLLIQHQSKEELKILVEENLSIAILEAKSRNWPTCAYNFQKFLYLNKSLLK